MIVTYVHVWVKPEFINEFMEASMANQKESVNEPGNLRFDFSQDIEDPSKFILYEAYENEEAAKNHKETAHYLKWKERVANMMAKPREGVKHHLLSI
ncbi:MAG: antibiotic biosynthesis monooxygenase [Bacteroidales bacterium]|nr:antibiotic biosynthesis monooxygenase [Bacteroidales bacterium]